MGNPKKYSRDHGMHPSCSGKLSHLYFSTHTCPGSADEKSENINVTNNLNVTNNETISTADLIKRLSGKED